MDGEIWKDVNYKSAKLKIKSVNISENSASLRCSRQHIQIAGTSR